MTSSTCITGFMHQFYRLMKQLVSGVYNKNEVMKACNIISIQRTGESQSCFYTIWNVFIEEITIGTIKD